MNRHDDTAPSPVMVAASSSSSQSARALQHALRGILRGGNRQSFARLQSELLALVQPTTATTSPDRPYDDEETNHNNNNAAAAAAAVWFEPDPVTGWTFLHYCASTDDMPSQHWEWLLQHCPAVPVVVNSRTATTTPLPFLALETALGETVVDIFLQHRLGQLKWQSDTSKARAARLVQVLVGRDRTIMAAAVWTPPPSSGTSTTTGAADAKLLLFPVAVQEEEEENATTTALHEDDENVRTVRTFLRDFYLLLQKTLSSHGNNNGDDPKQAKTVFDWRTALARIGPNVPAIVADWMESYLEQQQELNMLTAEQSSRNKQRALHILCQTKPRMAHYMTRYDQPPLLFMCLTEAGANTVIPETGLWPMEQALQSGWSFTSMYELWKRTTMITNSSSLSSSRLPLCAYAAMVNDDDDERALQVLARHQMCHGGPFPVYGWHMASDAMRHDGMAAARREFDRHRLTCIYECLRAAPSSLLSSSWRRRKRTRRDESKAALPGQLATAARPEPV